MKKIIALLMAAVIAAAAFTQPIYAAEEPVAATVYTVRPLGVTPRLRLPVLPQVSRIRITPKLNYNIDFSAYIPKIKLN